MPAGRKFRLNALSAALAAAPLLLAAACSSDSALTLEEYAAWCATPRETGDLSELDSGTWSDAVEAFKSLLDETTSINPPEEVRQYHDGSIDALEAFIAFMEQEDPDAPYSTFSLVAIFATAGGIAEAAEESLSPNARTALEEAGCLDQESGDNTPTNDDRGQVDRSEVAAIGDRITVERPESEDRFEMIVRSRPERVGDTFRTRYRVPVTVFAVIDEWSYDYTASVWTADQIELVSAPDENGRIYKLVESPSFGDRPKDSLEGVILVIGGKHDGALYFPAGDAPAGTQFVELRYPAGDVRRVVDLSR